MPFEIGTPFSPQILSLVQEQQKMQRQANRDATVAGGSKTTVTKDGSSDRFLNQQFAAEQAGLDRELRTELADKGLAADESRLDRQQEQRREDRAFAESVRGDETSESNRRFGLELGLKKRALEDKEERSRIQNENALLKAKTNTFKEVLQFGGLLSIDEKTGEVTVGKGIKGSKGALRDSNVALNKLKGNKIILDTKKIVKELAGELPEQIDDANRTKLIEQGLRLREEALRVKTAQDAQNLALRLWNNYRDPLFGGFGDQDNIKRIQKEAGTIFRQIKAEQGPEMASIFGAAYQEAGRKITGDTARDAQLKRNSEAKKKREASEDKPSPGQQLGLDPFIQKALGGAPAGPQKPSAVGR